MTGDSTIQVVYQPGIYSVKITACAIETILDIEVFPTYGTAVIEPSRPLCEDDTIILMGSPGLETYLWSPVGDTTPNISVSDSGVYVLTTTDTNGCTIVSDSFTVSIVEIPAAITLLGNTTFCEGDSVMLQGNADMDNYQWTPGNETTQTITVKDAGTYYLTTIDTNGCEDVSDSIVLMVPSTVAEIDSTGDLNFCEDDSRHNLRSTKRLCQLHMESWERNWR